MLFDQDLLSLSQAAKVLPAVDGHKPHVSTIWRWATRGIKGIRLETRKIGGRIVTSREALEKFTAELADAGPATRTRKVSPKPRTASQRERAIADAERELANSGL